jgi:hypothetical protein
MAYRFFVCDDPKRRVTLKIIYLIIIRCNLSSSLLNCSKENIFFLVQVVIDRFLCNRLYREAKLFVNVFVPLFSL